VGGGLVVPDAAPGTAATAPLTPGMRVARRRANNREGRRVLPVVTPPQEADGSSDGLGQEDVAHLRIEGLRGGADRTDEERSITRCPLIPRRIRATRRLSAPCVRSGDVVVIVLQVRRRRAA
jgi:hypothetical protein